MSDLWRRDSTLKCSHAYGQKGEAGNETVTSTNIWNHVAFLSEAQGVNGSPVIIFRECPTFGELHAQDLSRLLVSLTIMNSPSLPQVGYTLVIDSRREKWTSMKKLLKHIARSFPTDLQLVLVLMSMPWWRRVFCSTVFNSVRKEFTVEVPVFVLSSVIELAEYIDPTHLPPELKDKNEKQRKLSSKFVHLKRQHQSQRSLELRLKTTELRLREEEMQKYGMQAALENQLLNNQTLQKKRDEALAEGDNLKSRLEELHENCREVLMRNEQLQSEMSRMAKTHAETFQKLSEKDLHLKQQSQYQTLLENRLKDTEICLREEETQRHAVMAALENQLLHAHTLQNDCDTVLAQRDRLKVCIEKFHMNLQQSLDG